MQFLDKRDDNKNPVSETLLRVRDLIIEKIRNDKYFENFFIFVRDYDPKIGYVEHLQMNFEPPLKDLQADKIIASYCVTLLQNTEWKRYAWGVYLKNTCSCPKKCDCQNPPPKNWDGKSGGPYHISNLCPEHNHNPRPHPECPVHN